MPALFTLSLGSIPISLIPDVTVGEYDLVKRSIDFCSPAVPKISLQVHCGWFPELAENTAVYETQQGWQLFHSAGKAIIKTRTAALDPCLMGVFAADFRSGDIYTASSEENSHHYIFPLGYPLGELYMMNLLGAGLGMLFHASGVIDQGRGYLFTGHGRAGKTTTARLWQGLPGVQVVNDDKVIVRQEAGEFRLYGTPWHGEGGMALPDSAPLKRIFILKQAAQNYLAPLRPVQAAGMLLARTFVPLWDADKIDFSLKFLDELCQAVPCQELGFVPDSSAVDFVRNLP
jgi:hypothetical protein